MSAKPSEKAKETHTSVRVQRKRTKGWKMPENTVYVGRPTTWGNPFIIGGEAWRFSVNVPYPVPETVEEVLEDYRYFVNLWMMFWPDWLDPLKGKNLACWCPLDKKCHVDVLLEMLNGR